ncbi:hypothetical protein PJP10_02015 [Mycobacterium kansasii]
MAYSFANIGDPDRRCALRFGGCVPSGGSRRWAAIGPACDINDDVGQRQVPEGTSPDPRVMTSMLRHRLWCR